MTKDTIGIDISKATLDVFWHSRDTARIFPNSDEGFIRLCNWLKQPNDTLIVFEATGAYHRGLERCLSKNGMPFIKVNPKQARRFAQALGRLSKTDSVDAKMLAHMGIALGLEAQGVEAEDVHDLRELLTARRALVKDQVMAETRLATAINPIIREQLSRRINDIAVDLQALDKVIEQIAKT